MTNPERLEYRSGFDFCEGKRGEKIKKSGKISPRCINTLKN